VFLFRREKCHSEWANRLNGKIQPIFKGLGHAKEKCHHPARKCVAVGLARHHRERINERLSAEGAFIPSIAQDIGE
jgi:hypothetical protein